LAALPASAGLTRPRNLKLHDNVTLWGLSGTFATKLGGLEFKSITAYRSVARDAVVDYDATPFDFIGVTPSSTTRTI